MFQNNKRKKIISETFYLHNFCSIWGTWWCLTNEEFSLQLFELTSEIHLDLCDAHFHPLLRFLFLFPLQQVLYDSQKRKFPTWFIESSPAKCTATAVLSHWWGWRLESERNHPVFKTWEVINTQASPHCHHSWHTRLQEMLPVELEWSQGSTVIILSFVKYVVNNKKKSLH